MKTHNPFKNKALTPVQKVQKLNAKTTFYQAPKRSAKNPLKGGFCTSRGEANFNESKTMTKQPTRIKNERRPQIAMSVKELGRIINDYDAALLLSNHIKHRRIYIKKEYDPNDEIASIIGRLAASTLHDHFKKKNEGGIHFYITPSGSYRAEAIRLRATGLSIAKISRRFNVSEPAIAAIVGSNDTPGPLPGGGGVGSPKSGGVAGGTVHAVFPQSPVKIQKRENSHEKTK